jgi:drug/metabolite transporter (DMT)-like permease
MTRYLYVATTLLLTVYGQLIVKWRVNNAGHLPADLSGKLQFLSRLILDPWVISAFLAAFAAAASWMMAMTHFSLSRAYPFMSLSFALVLVGSALWLNEVLSWPKVAGILIIAVGIIVSSQ